jgi:hypothetical protein
MNIPVCSLGQAENDVQGEYLLQEIRNNNNNNNDDDDNNNNKPGEV